MNMKVGIGQDSHRFDFENKNGKKLILGGVVFENHTPLAGNSDADVILHAITNAVSSITGVNIIGGVSDELCLEKGITDSKVYLHEALKYLSDTAVCHVAISIEGKTPKITPRLDELKQSIAQAMSISPGQVGITATTGEGLTAFGRGEGIQVFAIVTVE